MWRGLYQLGQPSSVYVERDQKFRPLGFTAEDLNNSNELRAGSGSTHFGGRRPANPPVACEVVENALERYGFGSGENLVEVRVRVDLRFDPFAFPASEGEAPQAEGETTAQPSGATLRIDYLKRLQRPGEWEILKQQSAPIAVTCKTPFTVKHAWKLPAQDRPFCKQGVGCLTYDVMPSGDACAFVARGVELELPDGRKGKSDFEGELSLLKKKSGEPDGYKVTVLQIAPK